MRTTLVATVGKRENTAGSWPGINETRLGGQAQHPRLRSEVGVRVERLRYRSRCSRFW